jgi:hypothetical protein
LRLAYGSQHKIGRQNKERVFYHVGA